MTNDNDKKQDDQKSRVDPIAAALTGAAFGAATVGIAGAAVLANDENRKKVEEVVDEAKDNVQDVKEDIKKKIAKGQEIINEVATSVKDSTKEDIK